MILKINTTEREKLILGLENDGKNIAYKEKKVGFNQTDQLLAEIEKLLEKNKIKPNQLKKIKVDNQGGSFTSLRIGVVVANALSYAWGVEVEALSGQGVILKNKKIKIVKPEYGRDPNITKAKKRV